MWGGNNNKNILKYKQDIATYNMYSFFYPHNIMEGVQFNYVAKTNKWL